MDKPKPQPFTVMTYPECVTCAGCGAGWTFMGTGYCGPCLQQMDAVPEPIPLIERSTQ